MLLCLQWHLLPVLLLLTTLSTAQNSSLIPANQPNAYTEYVYGEQEVMMKTEKYKGQAAKFSLPVKSKGMVKEDLLLDIYYTAVNPAKFGAKKPLIIFAPGVGDNRAQVSFICKDLARRGYIAASISTRDINPFWLTINANDLKSNPNKKKKLNPFLIYTAAMDLHLAINYMIKQRAATYGIDPECVIVAGGSKGGATALQAAFMDKKEANASFGKDANKQLGMNDDVYDPYFNDFDESLQKNNIKGVVAFYGAVYDLSFITPQENKPVFMFHGNKDPFVPYKNNNMMFDPTDVTVYGSAEIAKRIKSIGNSYSIVTGKEVGHTITPACNYNVNEFPKGYPMNWYPEMLAFLKSTIINGQSVQHQKVVECTPANGCNPTQDAATSKCRAVNDNASMASNSAANSSPVDLGSSSFTEITYTPPVFNNNIAAFNADSVKHCSIFSFDGDDFIRVKPSVALTGSSVVIDFWLKKEGMLPPKKASIFYTAGNNTNLDNSIIAIGFVGETTIGVHIKDAKTGRTNGFLSPIPAIDNNWHHYAIVYYDKRLDFYVDGKRCVNRMIPFSINTANTFHYFGGSNYTYSQTSFQFANTKGQMDNIRYWTNIPNLSDATVIPNFVLNGKGDIPGFLAGFWKLDENNQMVKDVTGNKNDGTRGMSTEAEKEDPTFIELCKEAPTKD